MSKFTTCALLAAAVALTGCASTQPGSPDATTLSSVTVGEPAAQATNPLVVEVAAFAGQRPAGLVVTTQGRIFVTFPWNERQPELAVGELRPNGETVAFPSKSWNQWDGKPGPSALRAIVCGQALTLTQESGREFLWILDSGNPGHHGVITAGPKIFKIDLTDDSIAQVYYFDHLRDFSADSRLSELRVDASRQIAYVSDAAKGGIYVIDLKKRDTRGVLFGHASTQPEAKATADGTAAASPLGVAGLELSADNDYLYYHAASGRTLYRVATEKLRDVSMGEEELASTVEDCGQTGSAMDGLTLNPQTGDLYMAALEHDAVFVRDANGSVRRLVADARLHEPDSIALAGDGYLYFTSSASGIAVDRTGYVLKVSLDYLARAAEAEELAAEASRALLESQRQSAEAQAKVERARRAAAAEAAVAESALKRVSEASQRVTEHQFNLAKAEEAAADRFEAQEAAATQARTDAESAQLEAAKSAAAAEIAAEAARIAQLRADEAKAAADQAMLADESARRSDDQARVAGEQHRQALAAAAAAWSAAGELRAAADRLQDEAEQQQARAQTAAAAWQAEQELAKSSTAALERARLLAEAAQRSLNDAQLAEVRRSETLAEPVEVADVPTN